MEKKKNINDKMNDFRLIFNKKNIELVTYDISNTNSTSRYVYNSASNMSEKMSENMSQKMSEKNIDTSEITNKNYIIDIDKERCLKKKHIQRACNNNLYICFFLTIIICVLISYTLLNLTNTLNDMKLKNLGNSLEIVGEKLNSLDRLNNNLELIISHINDFSTNFNKTIDQHFIRLFINKIINDNNLVNDNNVVNDNNNIVSENTMGNNYIPSSKNSISSDSNIFNNGVVNLDTNRL